MSRHTALRTVAVVAGLLLLADALFVNALGVGAATHTYERVNVSVADGSERLAFENEPSSDFEGLARLDCYENPSWRLCLLEAWTLDDGSGGPNVTVSAPATGHRPAAPFAYHDGQFYQRLRERPEGADGPAHLKLAPRDAETVLSAIAVPPAAVSERKQRVLRTGRLRTREPLDVEGTLVRTEAGYATLAETLDTEPDTPRRLAWGAVEGLVGFLLVAGGVGSLRRPG